MAIGRRAFIVQSAGLIAGSVVLPHELRTGEDRIMSVSGWIQADRLGFTLSHEHIMVDFIGADRVSPKRYDADEVFATALPHLHAVKAKGCRCIVECTPSYLGRDVQLLKRLSDKSAMTIITNTGYYGAAKEKYLPAHAYTESASQIARRWIREWEDGIEGTGTRPGFIKCGVDQFPLSPVQMKMIEAAGITHLSTGLTIGVHTGDGKAAQEELKILRDAGVHPRAWIWIHAQNETDRSFHIEAARAGAWISFDSIHEKSLEDCLRFLKDMKNENLLEHVLLSHDAGWYHVGEEKGGNYTGYTFIADRLLPAMKESGFTEGEITQLFTINPAKAFAVRVRKA